MSDTPETSAAAFDPFAGQGGEVVDADFSRKLERERDEARDIGERLSKQGLDMMDENRALKSERDEARTRCQDLETALAYSAEGQTLLSKFLQAVKDRDEARALAILFAEAIVSTLEENRHLADGENCTLARLKAAVPHWK